MLYIEKSLLILELILDVDEFNELQLLLLLKVEQLVKTNKILIMNIINNILIIKYSSTI